MPDPVQGFFILQAVVSNIRPRLEMSFKCSYVIVAKGETAGENSL